MSNFHLNLRAAQAKHRLKVGEKLNKKTDQVLIINDCNIVGFYTGDIYNSSLNKRDGWAGEGHTDRNTLNVKTHLKPSAKGQPQFERAVLLLRDVGDAVMAEFNRLMAGPVGRVPNAMYETDGELKCIG